jgi:hypothetical protein
MRFERPLQEMFMLDVLAARMPALEPFQKE